ncbi:MAG: hypothetical protein K2N73_17990 [Lachnospiraceae bacterium]|nr:hypothetical protein [Lachnospiraceae bacterium]
MNKRTHRIIGLFFAILLFLSGMYMDTITAESLFVYDFTGEVAASLISCHSDMNSAAICTTGLLNAHSIELQSLERYPERYQKSNAFLSLQRPGFGALSQGKSYIHHAVSHLFCRTQNELVTDYMHQSDGKKRI